MRAPAAGSYHFDRPESLWFEQLENLSEDELYELARRRSAAPPRLRRGAQTLRTQRHLCHLPAPPPAASATEHDRAVDEREAVWLSGLRSWMRAHGKTAPSKGMMEASHEQLLRKLMRTLDSDGDGVVRLDMLGWALRAGAGAGAVADACEARGDSMSVADAVHWVADVLEREGVPSSALEGALDVANARAVRKEVEASVAQHAGYHWFGADEGSPEAEQRRRASMGAAQARIERRRSTMTRQEAGEKTRRRFDAFKKLQLLDRREA